MTIKKDPIPENQINPYSSSPTDPSAADSPAPTPDKPPSAPEKVKSNFDDILGDMPPIDPAADQIAADAARKTAESGVTDKPPPVEPVKGPQQAANVFDPRIHCIDSKTGKPLKNKDGTYRLKPTWQRAKVGTETANATSAEPRIAAPDVVAAESVRQAAIVAAGLTFVAAQSLLGPEWAPINDPTRGVNEPALVAGGFEEYFKSMGNVSLPPWAALALALGSYAAPRVALPQTKSRAAAIWDRCKKIGKWMRSKVGM